MERKNGRNRVPAAIGIHRGGTMSTTKDGLSTPNRLRFGKPEAYSYLVE